MGIILVMKGRVKGPKVMGVGIDSLREIVEARARARRANAIAGFILLVGLVGIAIAVIITH